MVVIPAELYSRIVKSLSAASVFMEAFVDDDCNDVEEINAVLADLGKLDNVDEINAVLLDVNNLYVRR